MIDLFAGENTMDGYSFAHISDPHLSSLSRVRISQLLINKRLLGYLSWSRRRQYEHKPGVLSALREDISASGVQRVLVSGDLTHLGFPDEFRQARLWLDSLTPRDVALVPGNHDTYVTEPWDTTFQQWLPYLDGEDSGQPQSLDDIFPTLAVRGKLVFIGLSSARPTLPFFASGRISQPQLDKLEGLLKRFAAEGLFRVVWLHHPPLPRQEKWRKRLDNGNELMEVVSACGAELILHGHRHRVLESRAVVNGKNIPVIGVSSASAMGLHGEVASYNQLSVAAHGASWKLTVQGREFNTEKNQFVAGARNIYSIEG